MDNESVRLDVRVTASPHTPGSLSSVIISQEREYEEFLVVDGNDDSVRSLGSYPDPSRYNPLIFLNFRDFQPDYVYQLLHDQLHDHVLSEHIADQIVASAQRERSQSLDSPHEPLFVVVSVKLTQKIYKRAYRKKTVPYRSPPLAADLEDQESPEEEEDCAICLETLSGSEAYCQMPSCSHCFHEKCVGEWLNRHKNSCPLCRKPIFRE